VRSGAVNWEGTGSTTVTGPNGIVAELDPGGHYVWGTIIPTGEPQRTGAAVGASGTAVMTFEKSDSDGTSLLSDGGTDGGAMVTWSRTIAKVSSSRQTLWSDATDYAHETSGYEEDVAGARWVVLDAAEDALVGGNFNGTLRLGSTTIQSAGSLDAYVQVRDPSGRLKAAGRWGGPGTDNLTSLAVDASGNAILLGFSGPPPGSSSSTSTQFFVAKLGR
jgi:hypothetical protein